MFVYLLGLFGPVIYKGVEYPNIKMKWSAIIWGPIVYWLMDRYISPFLFFTVLLAVILYFKIFYWRLRIKKQNKNKIKLGIIDKIYIGLFFLVVLMALFHQTVLIADLILKKDPWLRPWDKRSKYVEPMNEEEFAKFKEKMRQKEIERIKKTGQVDNFKVIIPPPMSSKTLDNYLHPDKTNKGAPNAEKDK